MLNAYGTLKTCATFIIQNVDIMKTFGKQIGNFQRRVYIHIL